MIIIYFVLFIFVSLLLFIAFSLIFLFTNIKKYYLNIRILLKGNLFAFFVGLLLIGITILMDIILSDKFRKYDSDLIVIILLLILFFIYAFIPIIYLVYKKSKFN